MEEVLKKYEVTFDYSANSGLKRIKTVNAWMTQFINDYYTSSDATDLLHGIDAIISDNDLDSYEFYTQSSQLAMININSSKIYKDSDSFYNDNQIRPDFTLPTSHFKVIVEAWKNFLG